MPKQKLTVTLATYMEMLPKLVASGVTYEANEVENQKIEILFTGGY